MNVPKTMVPKTSGSSSGGFILGFLGECVPKICGGKVLRGSLVPTDRETKNLIKLGKVEFVFFAKYSKCNVPFFPSLTIKNFYFY